MLPLVFVCFYHKQHNLFTLWFLNVCNYGKQNN